METKPGSIGSGRMKRVFPNYAFIAPDQKEYGSNVFMNCQSARLADLTNKFQMGDRVNFVYAKSHEGSNCPWMAMQVVKEDNSSLFGTHSSIGEKDSVKKRFNFVDRSAHQWNVGPRFDSHRKQVLQGKTDTPQIKISTEDELVNTIRPLDTSSPIGKDGNPPNAHAKPSGQFCMKSRFLREKPIEPAPEIKGSKFPPGFLDGQRISPIDLGLQPVAVVHRGTQTDPIVEVSLLNRLINDKEVFDFIFPRYPDIIHQWITRSGNK